MIFYGYKSINVIFKEKKFCQLSNSLVIEIEKIEVESET